MTGHEWWTRLISVAADHDEAPATRSNALLLSRPGARGDKLQNSARRSNHLPSIEHARLHMPVPMAERADRQETSAPKQQLRILVVEDNEDGRQMLQMLLEMYGHEVFEAEDGPRGVELTLSLRPAIAFVDIGLPGLDGYEVARQVRAREDPQEHRTFLVALTGYGQSEDRRRAEEAGFDLHLVKPLNPDALSQLLQTLGTRGAGS